MCMFFQMRLDFNTFVISGPSTDTVTIGFVNEGEINGAIGTEACTSTQCQTDTFSITSPGTTPPVICGSNSGEHSKMAYWIFTLLSFIYANLSLTSFFSYRSFHSSATDITNKIF